MKFSAEEIDQLLERLFPINRSLSGDGNRETLEIIRDLVPLEIKEYPCGARVFNWTLPDELCIKSGWIKDSTGKKVVDFAENALHVVGYSEPVKAKMSFLI